MEAKFYIDADQPKVQIDGEWNALCLFLESDSSFEGVLRHIKLKKTRRWMGNASVVQLVSGSLFKVSTELELELKSVEVHQKKLLSLIKAWTKFEKERVPFIINV